MIDKLFFHTVVIHYHEKLFTTIIPLYGKIIQKKITLGKFL